MASAGASASRIYSAGRKLESAVWEYFKIDTVNNCLECKVIDDAIANGKPCGKKNCRSKFNERKNTP